MSIGALSRVGLVELRWSARRGEGGGAGLGKKDTGYLYKAFMVAPLALAPRALSHAASPRKPPRLSRRSPLPIVGRTLCYQIDSVNLLTTSSLYLYAT